MTSTNFHNAMNVPAASTANGAVSYGTPDVSGRCDGRLSWFFKGIRGLNFVYAAGFLEKSAKENLQDTFCLVMNTRDVLKGKGERELGRKAFQWLLINYPNEMSKVIRLIPEYGRWDDIYWLFPKKLKLDDILWVNGNFCCNVDQSTLNCAKAVQNEAIKIFKNQLQQDWVDFQQSKPISLAAKWAETEGSGDDKKFGLVQQLCTEWKIHPKGYRLRLTQMRAVLNVVETLCCGKKWDQIDYSKVPSQAMKKLAKAFAKNDEGRFRDWVTKLSKKDRTVKINTATLHPHQVVQSYLTGMFSAVADSDPLIEAQWAEIEKSAIKNGSMEKTIVVTDTSGSMYGNQACGVSPISVSTALSILIARSSKAPWNNHIIGFSQSPEFHTLTGNTLHELVQEVTKIGHGFNTNFHEVFNTILRRYDQYKLSPEDMPERVICISDMQFDQQGNQTNLAAIDQLFAQRKLRRPTLIFWNVGGALDFPATNSDSNVCLIGGFSPTILTTLTTMKTFSPECVLREVIDSERYQLVRDHLNPPVPVPVPLISTQGTTHRAHRLAAEEEKLDPSIDAEWVVEDSPSDEEID